MDATDKNTVPASGIRASAWDATDAQRFIDTHPRATEQEAVACSIESASRTLADSLAGGYYGNL